MLDDPKFIKIKIRSWWYIFFILQLSLLIFMIGSLTSSKWIYTRIDTTLQNTENHDSSNSLFKGTTFSGSLLKCTSSCSENWNSLSDSWCSYYQNLNANSSTHADAVIEIKSAKSICSLFNVLWIGFVVYTSFELLSAGFLACWASAMLMYMKKKEKCLNFAFMFCGLMWGSHYIGLIFYLVFTRSSFEGDCRSFESDGKNPKVCAADGPVLGLFVAVVLPLICVWFCILGYVVRKKYGVDAFNKKFEQKCTNTEGKLDISNYSVENAQRAIDLKVFKNV